MGLSLTHAILIPSHTSSGWEWQLSDPKAYEQWFINRTLSQTQAKLGARAAEPLPHDNGASSKSPLQITVQLIKRHHRLVVQDEELQTPAIVLTTLAAGSCYGPGSIVEAMDSAVDTLMQTASSDQAPEVRNPVLPEEIISRNWVANHDAYAAFQVQARTLASDWNVIKRGSGTGLPGLSQRLSGMFGESDVKAAITAVGRSASALGRTGSFAAAGGGELVVARGRAPTPRHTNFGD